MSKNKESRRIHILRDSVARKIAAGEVIDRPFSVIRELLDNSIDAASTSIEVFTRDGGLSDIRVIDDGSGMTREDLEICCKPHATSKIESEEDLLKIESLGFRGEALSSIAAVSKLEIISRRGQDETASKLLVHGGKQVSLEKAKGNAGTLVACSELFYNVPARKRFLKRPSAESSMCRNMVLEKALPFPGVSFKFFSDDNMKIFLPPSSLKERILLAFPKNLSKEFIIEEKSEGDGFAITAVCSTPDLYRKDRKFIQVFLNNRRIWEFPLVQAVEYGYSDFLPGGLYPYTFLFIQMNPEDVDFNIHPAKKEVRFRKPGIVHHAVVSLLKGISSFKVHIPDTVPGIITDKVHAFQFQPSDMEKQTPVYGNTGSSYGDIAAENNSPGAGPEKRQISSVERMDMQASGTRNIRYLGQVMGVFLIAACGDRVYFVDQHAAHERILLEQFREKKALQKLLIPIVFEATIEEDEFLSSHKEDFAEIGITLKKKASMGEGDCRWEITAVPEACSEQEANIVTVLKGLNGSGEDLSKRFYASISCRAAVKDGDPIDGSTALKLIEAAFELDNARCPHGRPIWFELSKDELYNLVGRT